MMRRRRVGDGSPITTSRRYRYDECDTCLRDILCSNIGSEVKLDKGTAPTSSIPNCSANTCDRNRDTKTSDQLVAFFGVRQEFF